MAATAEFGGKFPGKPISVFTMPGGLNKIHCPRGRLPGGPTRSDVAQSHVGVLISDASPVATLRLAPSPSCWRLPSGFCSTRCWVRPAADRRRPPGWLPHAAPWPPAGLDDEWLSRALEDGRERLASVAGPLEQIAYPHGRADERVAAAAAHAGFKLGFTTEWRAVRPEDDPRLLVSLSPRSRRRRGSLPPSPRRSGNALEAVGRDGDARSRWDARRGRLRARLVRRRRSGLRDRACVAGSCGATGATGEGARPPRAACGPLIRAQPRDTRRGGGVRRLRRRRRAGCPAGPPARWPASRTAPTPSSAPLTLPTRMAGRTARWRATRCAGSTRASVPGTRGRVGTWRSRATRWSASAASSCVSEPALRVARGRTRI